MNFWWLNRICSSLNITPDSICITEDYKNPKNLSTYKKFRKKVKKDDVIFFVQPSYGENGVIQGYSIVLGLPENDPNSSITVPIKNIPLDPFIRLNEIPPILHKYYSNGFYKGNNQINDDSYLLPLSIEFVEYLQKIRPGIDFSLNNKSEFHESLKYSKEQLITESSLSEIEVNRFLRVINRKRQITITGTPGTGKTFLAGKLAQYLISESDGFIETIQFHPAYTYEDFIQGLRPLSDEHGNLKYEVVKGRFIEFCEKAKQRTGKCVLIIDEINRANLAAVFGELMYLLEYREQKIKLAGSSELFSIPSNVYIIGTMNTADRSIALVDHALRRRFAFIELRPDYNILRKWHERNATEFDVEPLIKILEEVNTAIGDRHYHLGISFFLDQDLGENIADIWELEIYPYLEEYFYDNPEKCAEFQWENIQNKIIN